jgi:asparagine synthase (glutamine-hydrolysing)
MCGICGIFNLNGEPVSPKVLRNMTDAIIHRGPDSQGFYIDSFIGIGHRRLSIIDLSRAAHQPMFTDDDQYAITYNGEIYNFKDIRRELESIGHQFNSRSDTEVVLKAYVQWGPDCVNRFNGMFAFAIWDKTTQELFLARDRYGIKPLYYAFLGNCFCFASEQKAIITHPLFRRELNLEALLEYFTFQNIFTEKTLLKGIKLFPAGCWAKLYLGKLSNELNFHQYWDFNFIEPANPKNEMEYVEELQRLTRQAVQRQLVSDVELGCYLSGGIDSGSITAIAASRLSFIKTFTCGFDLHSVSGLELSFDEREKAEFMSYLFKTEHYEMVLKAGDMERILSDLALHLEEPRVGQSYPNYYIAQLASKFVKVVLTGTGGDELFGGYPWRYYRANDNSTFEDYIDKYYLSWQRLIPNKQVHKVFRPVWEDVKHVWTRDIFRDVFLSQPVKLECPEDYINQSLYFESKTFLHGLLMVEDKLSMAHGLESRVPFLDNDLVDFAMRVPVGLKLGNLQNSIEIDENEPGRKKDKYFQKTNNGKRIFRKAMQCYVPENVINGFKQGFSAPDASWFKGESIDYVREIVSDSSQPIYSYLDENTVKDLVNEHLEGRLNRRLFIWSLLNFNWWLHHYLL